jgi:2-dehydro-3-deoxy-D-gluconate 5-dehydrogenase
MKMATGPFDLTGKVAFITGGNGGLGLGMGIGLADAGAAVVVASRNEAKSSEAVSRLEAAGGRAAAVTCDVVDSKSIDAAVSAAVDLFGGIDILVNNSGTSFRAQPEDIPEEEWDRVIDTNLKGPFLVSKAVYPEIKKRGGGKIINIGSMMSIFASEYASPYASSKGGIVQFTKACAIAWAKDGINVNAILPGWIHTDMTGAFLKMYPERERLIADRTPMARWGQPAELAGTAVFLASAASNFVTGASIAVDGGYSIK